MSLETKQESKKKNQPTNPKIRKLCLGAVSYGRCWEAGPLRWEMQEYSGFAWSTKLQLLIAYDEKG